MKGFSAWLLLAGCMAPAAHAVKLPAPDIAALLAKDARQIGPTAYRFAAPVSVKITPATHGSWSALADGQLRWTLLISSPGATSLNFAFTRFALPEDAQLIIRGGPDRRGPYGARDSLPGQLWTPVVRSSEAVLELTVPADAKKRVVLELTQIGHGFRAFGAKDVVGPKSGDCNVDVACPAGDEWRDEIRSVARYTVGGALLCTGQLVNNTAQDFKPLFLTAAHCLAQAGAPTTVFYWNYETSTCGGTPDGALDQTQSGAMMLATSIPVGVLDNPNVGSDFSLLQLLAKPDPAFNVYYAGWDHRDMAPGNVTGIHHPAGDEKRISFDFDTTEITAYLQTPDASASQQFPTHLRVVDWDSGTTEGGSSGSGLWNADHRLVGVLSGGYAACGNEESDWYGRLNHHWEGLPTPLTSPASHLDPMNSGVGILDGADPKGPTPAGPQTLERTSSAPASAGAMPALALCLLLFVAMSRMLRPRRHRPVFF